MICWFRERLRRLLQGRCLKCGQVKLYYFNSGLGGHDCYGYYYCPKCYPNPE